MRPPIVSSAAGSAESGPVSAANASVALFDGRMPARSARPARVPVISVADGGHAVNDEMISVYSFRSR